MAKEGGGKWEMPALERARRRAKEGFDFREATLPALPLKVNLTKVCHEECALHIRFTVCCERQGFHNTVSQVEVWMAILDGRKIGKRCIGLFIGTWCIDWVGFGVPSGRKCVAQFGRTKAQVNVRLDRKDSNLRHLDCGVVDTGGR